MPNTGEDDLFPKCNLNGIIFKTIISGEKTGYKYSIVEILFPEGDLENEIPLHIQSKEIVIVYVINGNFKIIYGQQDIEAKKGMVLKLEKDIARSFKRIGNQEGELLVMYIPAGFENFFKDISSINNHKKQLQILKDRDRWFPLHLTTKKELVYQSIPNY